MRGPTVFNLKTAQDLRAARAARLDAVVAGWKAPHFEGRPCYAMADFNQSPLKAYGALADAREAGLVKVWIDEYDGLFRACLTDLGRTRREALL